MGKETKSVIITGVLALILVVGALWVVKEKSDQVDARQAEIAELKTKIDALKKEAAQRDSLVEELANLHANLAQYVKILPSPEVATEERLMDLVQEKCDRSQFGLKSFILEENKKKKQARGRKAPRRKTSGGGFTEIGLTMQASGTYEQFLRFLNSLERHESFLRVNSFMCQAGQNTVKDEEGNEQLPLSITLNVSTFRYDAGGK